MHGIGMQISNRKARQAQQLVPMPVPILGTGYQLGIRMDGMDAIDITALNSFITQQRDIV
jgi:hypothetical protein